MTLEPETKLVKESRQLVNSINLKIDQIDYSKEKNPNLYNDLKFCRYMVRQVQIIFEENEV